MTLFSLYHDAKNRIYYLPETTVKNFLKDSRKHTSPQGCRKFSILDGRAIYVLKDYPYPACVLSVLNHIHKLSEEGACCELVSLKCSKIDTVLINFTDWFLRHHKGALFKTAVAESAFFAKNYELLSITIATSEFTPYKEDITWALVEGRQDIVNLVLKHSKNNHFELIESALLSNNNEFFDRIASDCEKEEQDIEEFYMKFLELGRLERQYERAKRWVNSRGYALCHPRELP